MQCLSCEDYFTEERVGTCHECYEEANEIEERLKAEIDDLKAKISFLQLSPPVTSSDSDVNLIPSDEASDRTNLAVPAHRAVLVSTIHLPSYFRCLIIRLNFLFFCAVSIQQMATDWG